MNSSYWLCK